jgi:uncharacterized protein
MRRVGVTGWAAFWLVVAGGLAGLIGSAGGITSLISYPALLAVGLTPLAANIANLVALVVCWPSSALTSRSELRGTGPALARSLAAAAAGGVVGSVLLLTTPSSAFDVIVPWLVLLGSAALAVQPLITRTDGQPFEQRPTALAVWSGGLSIYGGYFGAGAGIMTLATVLYLHDRRLPQANAVKNMIVGASVLAAAAVIVVARPVAWSAVAPLAVGMFAGSLLGPVVARRLPSGVVRWAAVLLGVALAITLWIDVW